jgi:catechol 2,3-dioxygenase-like lactoylglutathione lyase family enzyme
MARIRHIAICSKQQDALAAFYRTTFGLTEVFRHQSATGNGIGVYLSDGEVNLAIIPATRNPEGINHFGFQVDDVQAAAAAALAAGASAGPSAVPQDGRQNEAFIKDPVGQRVDLSSAGWHLGGNGTGHVRHVAIMTEDPPKLAEFYLTAFGLHEVMRRPKERGAVYISDGYINLALLPNHIEENAGMAVGIDHFGFHVADVDATLEVAYAGGAKPKNYVLPRDGRFAETFMFDPAGQRVDLSSAGWQTSPSA